MSLKSCGRQGLGRLGWWGLLAPAMALYALVFFMPLGVLVGESVHPSGAPRLSLANYAAFFNDGVTFSIFTRTVRLAFFVTLTCLVFGYPLALFMRRAGPVLRLVALTIVVSPLLTSVIVRNVAWLLVLGREGMVNTLLRQAGLIDAPLPLLYNTFGVVVGVTHVYLAFLVLPVFSALLAIDTSVEQAASSLGASRFTVFRKVTVPLSLPGVIAGSTLVFVLTMGVYLTPVIMGGSFVTTLPMVMTDLVRTQFDWSRAAAFAIVLLAFIAMVMVASSRAERRIERMRGEL
ncbi:ABC transporter permease [Xanthobacter autotrophicus]|uniref:ABC transporter permease n=1 Tax=Xanthobacter TaxID=279 RepID=UPI0024AA1035|nr:ABC transporter permease [Xanthobacter autotrophicus]MDI4666485.1 ABC transporter permease [Xanthobacter autotrophicus]